MKLPIPPKKLLKTSLLVLLQTFSFIVLQANPVTIIPKPGLAFKTNIKIDNLDAATFAEWVDGAEKPIKSRDARDLKPQLPQTVLWTDKTEPSYQGVNYGVSKNTGARYLRIGFHTAVNVGSIFVDGGGRPSILKPGAAYPGNLNDDSQWIPAQRTLNGQLSNIEVEKNSYAIWVFPTGTQARAIRFSHLPATSDGSYECGLIGALVTEERYENLASLALVSTKNNTQHAKLLTNGLNDNWGAWGTRDEKDLPTTEDPIISKDYPDVVLLTWNQPVKLTGLVAMWVGFSSAEIQVYTGPASQHPRDAKNDQWQTVGEYNQIVCSNGVMWPNLMDFGKTVSTTAVRLKITGSSNEGGNLKPKFQDGKRVWMGELMALQSLGTQPLQASLMPLPTELATSKPPIVIPFTIKEAGYVTLVIEDKNGMRVRNLISETYFNAGKNNAYWDGLDDLGRDVAAAKHGVYNIPAKFVLPGEYKVRGLVRGEINTYYEFPFYSTGTPPWSTDDHLGGWLANHTAPQSALFMPAKQSPTGEPSVYLGNYITEGPDGLAWVDLEGKKMGGKKWVGGNWTAAPYLARDASANAAANVYAYVGSVWETDKQSGEGELRITALTPGNDKPIILYSLGAMPPRSDKSAEMGGLSVNNGIAVASLSKKNQLVFIDVKTGKALGISPLDAPKGSAFDAKGQFFILSGKKLLKYNDLNNAPNLSAPQTIISAGLEAPVGLTLDTDGNIYISDAGTSHQVKVFTAEGKFVRAIGKPGAPKAGPYDSLHMNNPAGITIDSKQQLWVAENDFLPKRVSVWTLDGKLIKTFYGPCKYGGGGVIDQQDKTKFYYAEETRGSMEFKLDWKTGKDQLTNIFYRENKENLQLATRSAGPENALYYNGKRYFTNCYNSSPTSGHTSAFLFVERNGIAVPAAAMGRASEWDILKEERFKASWPANVDLNGKGDKTLAFFMWSDLNSDGKVQTEEVVFEKGTCGGVLLMNDLSFTLTKDGKAMQYAPASFTPQGVPTYKLDNNKVLAEGVQNPQSSGGNQILAAPNGWTVAIQGILPFDKFSISGAKDGKPSWSYPNLWPGLHASHEAPLPSFAGQLVGPTRLLGGLMNLKGSDAGPIWAINSNHGMVYIFTSDGLFVATLFEPMRTGKRWRMPQAERGMNLKGITLGEENFWPSITQTPEGEVYMVDGSRSSIIKVDGLKNIQRLTVGNVNVTTADLDKSRDYQTKMESMRQKSQGTGILKVAIRTAPIIVDGKMDDWAGAEWVDIDKSGIKANFNSNSKPYNVTGAVAVVGDRLFVGYRTADPDLLKNSGEMVTAPFKTGGALDLMIGTDGAAKKDRSNPVAGDLRLLVTVIKGKTKALLYRAVVAGTKQADKVPFASPWRTISFDKVDDISDQVAFAAGKDGNYEISVPLSVLNLTPTAGLTIKGDIGILRGDGAQTISRVYWSNKATGIVSDVPAEAELTPALWGAWEFK